jgi:hypothetical protein
MSTSLDAAKWKVQWAEKHFSDFKDIVLGRSTGIDTRATTVRHYDLPRLQSSASAQFLAPPPECRLAFGDAIHQLRSSLDHITYAMVQVLTSDVRILRRVDFPIFTEQKRFDTESRGVKCLRDLLAPEQFAAIQATQPYQRRPDAPEEDPLWILSALDNIDKHRTILVVDPRLLTKRKFVDGTTEVIKQPPVVDANGVSFPLPTSRSADEVEAQETSFTIVLAETGLRCDNRIVFGVWRELVENVKGVISEFESKGLV